MYPPGYGGSRRSLLSYRGFLALALSIILILITAVPVYSADFDSLREEASTDADDIIMVDGPFYVDDKPYYTLDFMQAGKSRETKVYGENLKETGGRTARKVLAVRDMKYILIADPLFYAPGDYDLIVQAAEYDIQNARNVAELSEITAEERAKIEEYFEHYRQTARDVAEVSRITGEILYPSGALEIKDEGSPRAYEISLDTSKTGYYSYEGFEELVSAYEKTVEDYRVMVADLKAYSDVRAFAGQDKTDEMLDNLSSHVDALGVKVLVRGELIRELGRPSLCGPSFVLLLSVIPPLLRRSRRALPLAIALILPLTMLAASGWSAEETIPTPDELALQIEDIENVPIYIDTREGADIDSQTVRNILREDPSAAYSILKGESVTVIGPYHYYGQTWYILEISENGEPAIVFVKADTLDLVRNQGMANQILKAVRVAKTLEEDPIYTSKSALDVRKHLSAQLSLMDSDDPARPFIEQEISNLETGEDLEKQLIEEPDFETLDKLNENLLQGFIILSDIERITSKEEAADLTSGFTVNIPRIETIVIISTGLTAGEHYVGKKARYKKRSLIKFPVLKGLAEAGERPSKGYFLSYYIIKDTIYDNELIYQRETKKSKFVEEYLERWRTE